VPVVQEIHRDGLVEMTEVSFPHDPPDAGLVYPENVVAVTANAILTAHRLRSAVGAPEAEYALEVEVSHLGLPPTLAKFGGRYRDMIGPIQPVDLRLPRLTIGPLDELDGVLRWVARDLVNSAGADLEHAEFKVSLPHGFAP
jgi:hypothetical protein